MEAAAAGAEVPREETPRATRADADQATKVSSGRPQKAQRPEQPRRWAVASFPASVSSVFHANRASLLPDQLLDDAFEPTGKMADAIGRIESESGTCYAEQRARRASAAEPGPASTGGAK